MLHGPSCMSFGSEETLAMFSELRLYYFALDEFPNREVLGVFLL